MYARKTSVSPERSQAEIQNTLRRYGADGFGTFEQIGRGMVMFQVKGLNVKIEIKLPDRDAAEFNQTETGRRRSMAVINKAHEQAVRQRWRALLLAIRAKLEAVESGISTLEVEFLPFVVLGDGRTVGDHVLPALTKALEDGRMPKRLMLPLGA